MKVSLLISTFTSGDQSSQWSFNVSRRRFLRFLCMCLNPFERLSFPFLSIKITLFLSRHSRQKYHNSKAFLSSLHKWSEFRNCSAGLKNFVTEIRLVKQTLYCIILHYIALHCIALRCIVLYLSLSLPVDPFSCASWIHSFLDNAIIKLLYSNRTETCKTGYNSICKRHWLKAFPFEKKYLLY